jgi:hypothetical protein
MIADDVRNVGPREVLVADKDAIHKILVEEDLIKAPSYDLGKFEGKIASLITERDRTVHRRRVSTQTCL